MNFQLIYDGPGLSNHEINPKELSSALMGIDSLLNEANLVLNNDKAKVKIKVKGSFETGSFKINFHIAQDIIEKTRNIFSDLTLSDAETILTLLFFSGTGLTFLIKFLAGLRPDKIYENEDETFIVEKHGQHIKVERKVIELYKNYKLRKAFEQTLSPLRNEGIIDCAFMRKGNGREEFVHITKAETHFFDTEEPSKKQLDDPAKFTTNLNIINLSFKENNKWYVNDGQSSFHVTVEDEQFLQDVENNKPFSKGDILKVTIRREQFYIEDEAKLKTENFIESVLEHETPSQFSQASLFNNNSNKESNI